MDKDWEEKVNEPAQELGADLFKRLDAQEIDAQFLEALGLTHTPHQSSISPTIPFDGRMVSAGIQYRPSWTNKNRNLWIGRPTLFCW